MPPYCIETLCIASPTLSNPIPSGPSHIYPTPSKIQSHPTSWNRNVLPTLSHPTHSNPITSNPSRFPSHPILPRPGIATKLCPYKVPPQPHGMALHRNTSRHHHRYRHRHCHRHHHRHRHRHPTQSHGNASYRITTHRHRYRHRHPTPSHPNNPTITMASQQNASHSIASSPSSPYPVPHPT